MQSGTHKGHTLFELQVVIAIIAAVLIPVLAKERGAAKRTHRPSNQKLMGVANSESASGHDEKQPSSWWADQTQAPERT